jgi:hypothetical protein
MPSNSATHTRTATSSRSLAILKEDLLVLLGRLIERIRRALSAKHLTDGNLGLRIANQVVRGRIEWDDAHDGRLPMLIIDGREVTWEDFGRMLMSFEGFHFE